MGRAVTMLIDREIISVFGDVTDDEPPVFAQRATEELAIREAKIAIREREVDAEAARMRERGERLRRWEDALGAREQRAETVSKITPRESTGRAKIRTQRTLPLWVRPRVQALPRPRRPPNIVNLLCGLFCQGAFGLGGQDWVGRHRGGGRLL